MVFPTRLCLADVLALAILRAAGEHNNKLVAVPPEVNAVAGAKINLVLRTPLPTVLALDRLPSARSERAVNEALRLVLELRKVGSGKARI